MWTVQAFNYGWVFTNTRTRRTFWRDTNDGWTPATVLSFVKSINMR